MNKNLPFSIPIFVANGDRDGFRIIERSNWNGGALVFPCPLLPENDCSKRVRHELQTLLADKRSPA